MTRFPLLVLFLVAYASNVDPGVETAYTSIPLELSQNALHYLMDVEIGVPGQTIPVIFDTGSSELSLLETNCTAPQCYDSAASSTFGFSLDVEGNNATGSLNLAIDGEVLEGPSLIVYDTLTIPTAIAVETGNTSFIAQFNYLDGSFNVTTGNYSLHSVSDFAGLLGAGYSGLSRISCINGTSTFCSLFFEMTFQNTPEVTATSPDDSSVFALDMTATNTGNKVDVGGIDATYAGNLLWAEQNSIDDYGFHRAIVYHMTICDVPIFSKRTSQWAAIIDTGSSCLGLPTEFFDVIATWSDLTCTTLSNGRNEKEQICYVDAAFTGTLPTIAFYLEEGDSDPLYIPLSSLLLDAETINGESARRLCIVEGRGFEESQFADAYKTITFGTKVVESLYTVLHGGSNQVAFAQRNTISTAELNDGCAAPITCESYQVYDLSSNSCSDAPCSDYLFYELNRETSQCQFVLLTRRFSHMYSLQVEPASCFHSCSSLLYLIYSWKYKRDGC